MLKCASFFAGVGGIDLGFEKVGFETVYANEFDPYAADTYECNFNIKVDRRDIHDVKTEEISDFDVLLAGFPCQAFSIAGYREGFEDKKGRGELFFEVTRIIEARKPRIVFLENVKNLVSHDNGNTFRVICEQLDSLGYKWNYQVMNACEFGNIPQNRERIYIVAFREKEDYANFRLPMPVRLTKKLSDVIDFEKEVEDKYYYTKEKCSFYDTLKKEIKNSDTTYQWRRVYVRENKSNLVPTLTANMGTGGHNVPLILTKDSKIRKLTPRECFNVQGYPASYHLPNQSNCHLYKQAGNSVVVPVIERIAGSIKEAVEASSECKEREELKQQIAV
ncbi:MAG TPA: DNA cytosine methyltransferase [Candidatus Merdenecus merdavium]|nr:DNA cytosine methyltransferase [Candidatus Merdenecus merdavium]